MFTLTPIAPRSSSPAGTSPLPAVLATDGCWQVYDAVRVAFAGAPTSYTVVVSATIAGTDYPVVGYEVANAYLARKSYNWWVGLVPTAKISEWYPHLDTGATLTSSERLVLVSLERFDVGLYRGSY